MYTPSCSRAAGSRTMHVLQREKPKHDDAQVLYENLTKEMEKIGKTIVAWPTLDKRIAASGQQAKPHAQPIPQDSFDTEAAFITDQHMETKNRGVGVFVQENKSSSSVWKINRFDRSDVHLTRMNTTDVDNGIPGSSVVEATAEDFEADHDDCDDGHGLTMIASKQDILRRWKVYKAPQIQVSMGIVTINSFWQGSP